MKYLINDILRQFGYRISRIPPDEGLNAFEVQKMLLGEAVVDLTIFDVGAYKGDVTLIYKKLFPDSKVYCFEPFPISFSILKKNTSSQCNIFAINKGLGEYTGKSEFHSNRSAPTNSILATLDESRHTWGDGLLDTIETIEIDMETLDDFVRNNHIDKIDILKLDAQGSEYMVLNGARNTLEEGKIKMIYSEIIILPTYKGQKYLDEFLLLLRSYGFDLYNFFNCSFTRKGMLRQLDAIFIKSE